MGIMWLSTWNPSSPSEPSKSVLDGPDWNSLFPLTIPLSHLSLFKFEPSGLHMISTRHQEFIIFSRGEDLPISPSSLGLSDSDLEVLALESNPCRQIFDLSDGNGGDICNGSCDGPLVWGGNKLQLDANFGHSTYLHNWTNGSNPTVDFTQGFFFFFCILFSFCYFCCILFNYFNYTLFFLH